jgi:osmotically-inducible protein OsmY
MSRRYGERGYERYGGDEDERHEERDYEAGTRTRAGEEHYGGRHIRGLGYSDPARGHSPGREYDYGRDYGYGRDYDTRDSVSRDYGTRERGAREYGRRIRGEGYEGDDHALERGRDYERGYGRERERERERDPNQVRSFDTDYGRTTSRFYGRSGYEYGRDDYDRPNYGPEITEYRGRQGMHEGRRDERDERDARDERGRVGRGWWDRAADEVLSWFGDDEAARRRRAEGGHEIASRERGREGLYRGRGPKNYRRPDERIREEINDRLTDNDWLDASDIDVSVVSAEVVLSGTVDSRYSKRLAEDIAESVTGVSNVQNNLRVQSYQTGLPAASASTTDATVASDAPTLTGTTLTATAADAEGAGGTDSAANTRATRAGGRG